MVFLKKSQNKYGVMALCIQTLTENVMIEKTA